MNYQLHHVRNVSGLPSLELIEEDVIPSQGSWLKCEEWLQNRINELRRERSFGQIVVWMTKPASEGALVAIEYPADGQQGKLIMLIND